VKLLVTQRNSGEGQYATLSYCWGKTRQTTTTETTLPSFIDKGIKVKSLPKSLQDAISATEKLGIPYLWIDSLCIIQDSKADKEKEITQMAQIYKHATVTISAAIARDSGDGFLGVRKDILDLIASSYQLPMKLDNADLPIGADVYICPDNDLGFMNKTEVDPIDKRAWTYQETWLSPRLLIYSRGPIRWRCLSRAWIHGSDAENGVQSYHNLKFQNREKFFKTLPEPPTNPHQMSESTKNSIRQRLSWQHEWSTLAMDYSSRLLTSRTDKLPALSGLATEFGRLYGDIYLAGIWKSSLPWSLLWSSLLRSHEDLKPDPAPPRPSHISRFLSKLSISKRPDKAAQSEEPTYICPSWCFAAADGAITFNSPDEMYEQDGDDNCATKVVIHEASVTPSAPIAPFGEVSGGKITLTGPLQHMTVVQVLQRFVLAANGEPHIYWDYIIPDGGRQNPYFSQVVKYYRAKGHMANEQALITDKVSDPSGGRTDQEGIDRRPTPPRGSANAMLSNQSESGIWFLEITWDDTPTGLVLLRREDGIFVRIGFFLLGRNNYQKADWRMRGSQHVGDRDWNWDKGLMMCTITIE
jgi:hypothetical protein